MTSANVITLYYLSLLLMQVGNVLRISRQLLQLFNSLFAAQPDDYHRTSITSYGLRLKDNAIRVAIGLHLGANQPHPCIMW